MTFSAKYTQDGTITAGPLSDGETWSGITPASRFYSEALELLKEYGMPQAFVSAQYWAENNSVIKAIGDDGLEYFVPGEGTDVPPWPAFIEGGGTIDPWVAPPPAPRSVSKLTVLERMTNEEAETADGAMAGQPAKLRQIWGAANDIWDNSPWYPDLHTFFVALFGESRTDELLEMS